MLIIVIDILKYDNFSLLYYVHHFKYVAKNFIKVNYSSKMKLS